MTGARARGRTRELGFTLYEVIVALVLVGIALHPLVTTLAANTRMAADRRDRLDAQRLLRNETALVASADLSLVAPTRSYRADRSGAAVPDGAFLVTTTRTVRCGVGAGAADNAAEALPAGCASGGVVAEYRVAVTFGRAAGAEDETTVVHTFAVPADAPHGSAVGGTP